MTRAGMMMHNVLRAIKNITWLAGIICYIKHVKIKKKNYRMKNKRLSMRNI